MRKLLWRLFFSYLAIIVLSLAAATWFSSRTLDRFYRQSVVEDLAARARIAAHLFEGRFDAAAEPEVERLCHAVGDEIKTRVTVILPTGQVIGDSDNDPLRMENHSDRPEIKVALEGGIGAASRFSYTLKKEMQYVALPVMEGGRLAGVVRLSLPLRELSAALRGGFVHIIAGGLAVALLAALMSLFVSRRIERPISEMTAGANRFARGDFGRKLRLSGLPEADALAGAMNRMASDLDERIKTITDQREELEAVLSRMVEAVLVVDAEENIVRLNSAARALFFREGEDPAGRGLLETARNPDLLRFVRKTLAAEGPVGADITLRQEADVFLQGHGVPLRDANGRAAAALVVLHDITRIKNLENIRKDFVANVSHELRTPITSIKGFVETLQDGALEEPETAREFLTIIARHAERLNAIIEDLLSLARIEQESERGEIPLAPGRLREVLEAAVAACASKAAEKNIAVELACEEGLSADIDPTLLEQAVVNLIENAVKYSEPGGAVRVEGLREGGDAVLRVSDKGCGIPKEHLPRIFERFYRVDKARSRAEGGTGLGLAIVKHIVNAHHGRVSVRSAPGDGSVFSIHLLAEKKSDK